MVVVSGKSSVGSGVIDTAPLLNEHNDDDDESSSRLQFTPFLLRLHLIRHGETHANLRNIVLGQDDSPLTDNGLVMAQMAAQSRYINGRSDNSSYWRTYCSDLYRAHRTAKIVLGLEDIHGNVLDRRSAGIGEGENGDNNHRNVIHLTADVRLRELAKGAREGYVKSLSYEEAMARRIQEADYDNDIGRQRLKQQRQLDIPLLESIDDAWDRARDWIDSLVKDAYDEYYAEYKSSNVDEDYIDASCNAVDNNESAKIYNVFALSHSALIRTMIHKMVDSQLPNNYALTKEGSLKLPNLSRTIIDVRPYYSNKTARGSSSESNGENDEKTLRWKCRLVTLADLTHLSDDPSSKTEGPPYL